MIWESTPNSIALANKLEYLLPADFDFKTYIELYPDLVNAGIDNYQKAKEHYLFFGRNEGREYKLTNTINNIDILNTYEIWNQSTINCKNIMVFAPNAPDYDCSSGGNRLYELLKILKNKLHYNIYFFCNNPLDIKYIKALKNLDITTYYSSIDIDMNMEVYIQKLQNNNIQFQNVIFCWYDMAYQYMSIVKKYYPTIKTIVDSVDVHWIREQRGKDNNELTISQKILDHKKNIEKLVYNSADVVFAITNKDKSYIEHEIGYKNIKILSNIHYEKRGKLGKNIFFIGNYAHSPNIQAAIESIDIFNHFSNTQEFKSLIKKPKLLLVGPNINDRILSKLSITNNQNIKVLGQVEDLETIYKQSCLCLSPLYWGAGIKGKICDSSMRGIPILSTNIGNEGINFMHKKNALIADNTNEFVENLKYFFSLSDKDKYILGHMGKLHISKIVSEEAAISTLKHTLEDKHIVISIVAYKQTEKLKKCLQSIFSKTEYKNYTIAISDNSENNTTIKNIIKKFIKKYPNKIEYIKNKTNQYFIKSNNNIISNEKYKNSDIILLNDDIEILSDGWLNYLYSTAYSANNIAAVGGKTLYKNLSIAEAGAELYSDGTGKNLCRYQGIDYPETNIRKSVGYCSGCLLYIRRDIIEKIGALDTSFKKMYYEDSEWQYRAHINGFKTIYEPRCIAIHHEGSSSGNDISKGAKKYQEINRKIFVNKYKDLNIEQYNE